MTLREKLLNLPEAVPIPVVFLSFSEHLMISLAQLARVYFFSSRTDPVGPKALVPTTLPSSTAKPSGVSKTPDLGSGYSGRPLSGPAITPPWPRMSPNDVQRYTRVFSKVDTDHDGKITGEQARQLFLSWQLPRGGLTNLLHIFSDLVEVAAIIIHAVFSAWMLLQSGQSE